ncbi:MAG: YIP1 family protein [Clostridia bacterium]|nr:YIP1 family protein [Clostridia bacterium]
MKKFLIFLFITLIMISVIAMPVSAAVEFNEENSSYVFDDEMHTIDAPTAYTAAEIFYSEDFGEDTPITPEDVSVGLDGSIYVADATKGKVYKVSADRKNISVLQSFQVNDSTISLESPMGVFYSNNGELFVADSGTKYIYVFDENFKYKRCIEPITKEDLMSDQEYEPLKVCVDSGNRVYVIAANQTQGIIQFSDEGKFTGFLGATRVQPTAKDLLLQTFATDKQKESLLRLIPTEYNNLAIDEDSFIYASIGSLVEGDLYSDARNNTTTATPIRRLNPKGEDELLRQGKYPPMGDVNFILSYRAGQTTDKQELVGASRIVDTACRKNGVYCLLDSKRGRVYTYSGTGDLLFMFGGNGNKKDELDTPTAIDYLGNSLVIADKGNACIKIFTPTDYAEKVLSAMDYHEDGDYEKETAIWEEVRREYIGSELAYLGLGKTAYTLKNYEEAMEYFRLANNKTYYSKAYKAYRKEWGYQNVGWLFGGIVVLCASAFCISRIIKKKFPKKDESPKTLFQRVMFGKTLMFHPFKAFWDLKVDKVGSVASATCILCTTVLLKLIQTATLPYLLESDSNKNILLQGFTGIILIVGLFVISNWCLTSLMDGKGTFKDIYIYTCYSLFPLVIAYPIQTLLSQIVSLDEVAIYEFIGTFAIILVVFLLYVGTLVIHDYSAGKTIAMLLMTVIGMMILVFIAMLCFTLIQQVLIYIKNIISELQLR